MAKVYRKERTEEAFQRKAEELPGRRLPWIFGGSESERNEDSNMARERRIARAQISGKVWATVKGFAGFFALRLETAAVTIGIILIAGARLVPP